MFMLHERLRIINNEKYSFFFYVFWIEMNIILFKPTTFGIYASKIFKDSKDIAPNWVRAV